MSEFDAGAGRRLVTYGSDDDGYPASLDALVAIVAADASERAQDGWRLRSCDVVTLRQTGTTGNILFQSGGQYATLLGAVVLYVTGDA
jgi:hypothetical protein